MWGWIGRGLLTSMLEKLNFFRLTSLITALIRSMKFLSHKVALYLYKSTIQPCMEYCCHIWASAWSCYLKLLDKLQKQICKTVMLVFQLLPLKPLSHCWNVASLGIFFRYYFGRCPSELAPLVLLPILVGGILLILIDYMSPFLDVTRMSFPCTPRILNFLSIECFLLTYDLNGLWSRINRHLLTLGSF